MEACVFGINDFDIKVICEDEEGECSIDFSQEQLDKIAKRMRELLDLDLNDYFWNCFDDRLHQAIFEIF